MMGCAVSGRGVCVRAVRCAPPPDGPCHGRPRPSMAVLCRPPCRPPTTAAGSPGREPGPDACLAVCRPREPVPKGRRSGSPRAPPGQDASGPVAPRHGGMSVSSLRPPPPPLPRPRAGAEPALPSPPSPPRPWPGLAWPGLAWRPRDASCHPDVWASATTQPPRAMGLRVSPEAYDETAYTSTPYVRRRGGPVDSSCASGGESTVYCPRHRARRRSVEGRVRRQGEKGNKEKR